MLVIKLLTSNNENKIWYLISNELITFQVGGSFSLIFINIIPQITPFSRSNSLCSVFCDQFCLIHYDLEFSLIDTIASYPLIQHGITKYRVTYQNCTTSFNNKVLGSVYSTCRKRQWALLVFLKICISSEILILWSTHHLSLHIGLYDYS